MKKKLLSILLTLVLCLGLLPVSSFAADVGYDVTGGKIYFDPATGTITGCDESVTAADIPATIYDVPVTAIGEDAFWGHENLTSVTIPNGVKSIGAYAFNRCKGLTSVSIPPSVREICQSAFVFCDNLKTVNLSEGLQIIGESAFAWCDSLEHIRIPDSVTELGHGGFYSCDSLRTLIIGSGITEIPDELCESCESLEKIDIPPAVTTIGYEAFQECDSITSLTIPKTVKSLSLDTFAKCDSLESVVIEGGITTVYRSAFYDCNNLKRVEIQSGVEIIDTWSFSSCDGLSDIFIPKSVKEIGTNVFDGCDNLSDIYYEGSLADWAKIETGDNNDALASANIHFNCAGLPDATPTEPTTPAEPTEPMEPTEPTEPTDPTTPTEPVTPTEPTDPTTPTEPVTPTEPADPTEPTTPVEPVPQPEPGQKNPFVDVPDGAYYYGPVLWAFYAQPQITDGMDDTHFGPGQTVTRGQAVTFLWRSVGKPTPKSSYCPFTDVKTSDYYYQPVLWALEQGITDGTSATTFSPSATLTRAHIITFLWRTTGRPGDTGAGQWYDDAVNWARTGGFLDGTAEAFAPNANCPRSDVVTYLYRADQKGALNPADPAYDFVLDNCNWSQAFQRAKAAGGHLVRIETKAEYDTIREQINQRGLEYVMFRVGARRNENSADYYWVNDSNKFTGQSLNDTLDQIGAQWGATEPSLEWNGTAETVLEFQYSSGIWVWNDIADQPNLAPNYFYGYIIEY